jgi:hypothetical protein
MKNPKKPQKPTGLGFFQPCLVVVDVENADDAGDGGGGLHVGVLQAHLHGVKKLFKT